MRGRGCGASCVLWRPAARGTEYAVELLRVADAPGPRTVAASQSGLVDPLSARELTVLRLLASQLDTTDIAAELYLSVNTVRTHVKAIYRKLAVNSRADAVRTGVDLGLI